MNQKRVERRTKSEYILLCTDIQEDISYEYILLLKKMKVRRLFFIHSDNLLSLKYKYCSGILN